MSGAPATALQGIRVFDLSTLYAGPLIGTMLGDFGAEVVKVEHPSGDAARRWGRAKDGVPLWWKVISRNKRLVSLDLSQDSDRERARALCCWADVLIENFRPGRLERWGLGPEDLRRVNDRLIVVRVSGFGQTGPYRDQPGFGTLAESFSGFAHMTGEADGPPTLPPFGLADGVAAMVGTWATMMALYWRDANGGGTGQVIDLSLYEPLFSILGPQSVEYSALGAVQNRAGNLSPRTAPRNAYRTSDGRWVALSAGTQQIANRVFEAVERPELRDDERFSTARARVAHAREVDAIVSEWIARHPLTEVLDHFRSAQAPIAPIYDIAQLFADPHVRARQSIVEVEDPDLGPITMQNVAPRLSRTPGRIRHAGHTPIGYDNAWLEALLAPGEVHEDDATGRGGQSEPGHGARG